MTYGEVIENARGNMGPCKACAICNGVACKNNIPGPGAKGLGVVAVRNYAKWQEICINMDTICDNIPVDTKYNFFGYEAALPVFAGPVGAMKLHYGNKYSDLEYDEILISACKDAGILAFTGDGTNPEIMKSVARALSQNGGAGVPTVKPWDDVTLKEKMDMVKAANPVAIAMDIDAAGLPFLRNLTPPAGRKNKEELKKICEYAKKPFIIKGIMTVKGALKALEAGAEGIVVSNHGGRVLDQCPPTAEVLPEISDAVKGKLKIFVDGGIRSGVDIFKALALGADAVLIARPFVTAVYGGGAEGVRLYVEKLKAELSDTMMMCGCAKLSDIDRSKVRF